MRVVIITSIPFWHPGTAELIHHLKEHSIEAIAFDYFNAQIYKNDGKLQVFMPYIKQPLLRKIILKLGRNYFFKKQLLPNDLFDIHFVDGSYIRFLDQLPKQSKLIATLFGSDLFRTTNETKQKQKPIFERANLILMSDNMKPYFEAHFPGNTAKIYNNQYGSNRIDMVHDSLSENYKTTLKRKYNIAQDQIVITCGYNAKEEQQHKIMLDSLAQLNETTKAKIFLLFPLTYGKREPYLTQLKEHIKSLNIAHLIFEEKLSEEDLVATKIISDITLNTQTTDALASSIKEAFVANNLLIVADWLPYDIYADLGVYYIKSTQSAFTENINDVVNNLPTYKLKTAENAQKIIQFASWKKLVPDWIKMYQNL